MSSDCEITIGSQVHRKNPAVDRYQIRFEDLGDLRMREIPPHSHLEVQGLPQPSGVFDMEVYALNAGDEGEHEYLSVYGGASFRASAGCGHRLVTRLRQAFPDMDPNQQKFLRNPHISSEQVEAGDVVAHLYLNIEYKERPDTPVREAALPFVEGFRRMDRPYIHLFICHASEDKGPARDLSAAMAKLGSDVWLGEREIRVGDSIVQKIDDGLSRASHLVVLLSENSVGKPWVRKELSSALMRQLSEKSITVLPVRLDSCTIPPILADIRYADARSGMERAISDLEHALFDHDPRYDG